MRQSSLRRFVSCPRRIFQRVLKPWCRAIKGATGPDAVRSATRVCRDYLQHSLHSCANHVRSLMRSEGLGL